MNPLRSVGARLSVALLVVVAGALAVVYLVVVPSLESRLINSKLSELRRNLSTLRESSRLNDRDFYSAAQTTTGARVVLFELLPGGVANPIQDSGSDPPSKTLLNDPVALSASRAASPRIEQGTVERLGERYAEAAIVVPQGEDTNWVLLLSTPLEESLRDVDLVRSRLLIAGGIVLGLVLVVGYGGSWMFARRIRNLERAADRIASGRFDEPVTDMGSDEVGELARAFERMRQRLAQLDHARREFIANASHELRTPLFSLGGFLELLDDEELDEATRREFLTSMREQVTRLTKLATELLDLSRLDAGHLEVAREPVSLAETARVVAGEFAAIALQTEHALEVHVDDGAVALADESRVLQIARILVENALLHTPPGTSVRLVADRRAGRASLAVEDSGPGIDAAQTGHVFERFYRGEGTKAAGSGLGLAIARELARLMGGSIELESRPGRTRFALVLPDADAATAQPPELVPLRA